MKTELLAHKSKKPPAEAEGDDETMKRFLIRVLAWVLIPFLLLEDLWTHLRGGDSMFGRWREDRRLAKAEHLLLTEVPECCVSVEVDGHKIPIHQFQCRVCGLRFRSVYRHRARCPKGC